MDQWFKIDAQDGSVYWVRGTRAEADEVVTNFNAPPLEGFMSAPQLVADADAPKELRELEGSSVGRAAVC